MPGLFNDAEMYAANRRARALESLDSLPAEIELRERRKLIEDHPAVIRLETDEGWNRLCKVYARVASVPHLPPGERERRLARLRRLLLRFEFLYGIPDPWKMKLPAESTLDEGKPKRRPRKTERPKDDLVIAALVKHHRYESGGAILNFEPAKQEKLAALAGVNKSTVSRFFTKRFTDKRAPGHDGYVAACTSELIGRLLALWQRDNIERHADLRDDE